MADVALRSKGIKAFVSSSFSQRFSFIDWYSRIVMKIDLGGMFDDEDWSFRKLRDRIDYASHLQAHSVYIELPSKRLKLILLAQVINSLISDWLCPRIHFEVPAKLSSECKEERDFKDSWSQWNYFRTLIRTPARSLTIALRIEDLPDEEEQNRWMGEKIKMLIFPLETFVQNKVKCPVLSKPTQLFMQSLFDANRVHVSVALKGHAQIPGLHMYVQYLDHLINKVLIPKPDDFDSNRDVLQVPLQPLKDNLQSGTYEVFEKDPVKYEEYRKAILAAIRDRPGKDKL